MIYNQLETIRIKKPKIHCISNIVSANFCANGIIAVGGLPIMADDLEEVAEITSKCSGLNLSLGIPNPKKIDAMILAGKKANELHIPVILDPVGVGASSFRMNSVNRIIENVKIQVIRGNLSEIKSVYYQKSFSNGVDLDVSNLNESLEDIIDLAKKTAMKINCIVIITGEVDVVTDGGITYIIKNGHSMLANITGSGCLLSAIITTFVSVNRNQALLAAVTAVSSIGICGELIMEKGCCGSGSFATSLLDELYNLSEDKIREGAKYEIY